MPKIKRLLRFAVNHQILAGVAGFSWFVFFQITYHSEIELLRASITGILILSGYGVIRILQINKTSDSAKYVHLLPYRNIYFSIVLFAGVVYIFLTEMDRYVLIRFAIIAFISIVYPFFLKKIPYSKWIFVGICWILILPVEKVEISISEMFNLWLFIVLFVLPFDIRDAASDNKSGILTWANRFPENTTILLFIPLFLSVFFNIFFTEAYSVLQYSIAVAHIFLILIHFIILKTNKSLWFDVLYDGSVILLPLTGTIIQLLI